MEILLFALSYALSLAAGAYLEHKRLYKERKKLRLAGRPKPITCEICSRAGNICWDHDHTTGRFRGCLCQQCNTALGMVNDSPVLLQKLIEYLK
jgi:Recombination endonuclease VII